jgi:lysozyme|tara:strand:+ start:47 stop:538 length:492 start_codon:yes stop_codon:yes gene_type:complete
MNIDQLKKELAEDEGCVYEVYLDHLGKKTFGIGHLVTPSDLEYNLKQGTPVTEDRVSECFEKDIKTTVADCLVLYEDFSLYPEEVQLIIANMMFNLGRTRLSLFKDMQKCVKDFNWVGAADAMVDSRWYIQVPNRAERLVKRMLAAPAPEGNWNIPRTDLHGR